MIKYLPHILCALLVFGPATIQAKPLSPKQIKELKGHESLRGEMSKMILSLADLDIIVNRDKMADYEIFIEDAVRILDSLKVMRKIDKNKVFEPFFKELETPTKELLKYSKAKDPKAMAYPEHIFNACFQCHKKHRSY